MILIIFCYDLRLMMQIPDRGTLNLSIVFTNVISNASDIWKSRKDCENILNYSKQKWGIQCYLCTFSKLLLTTTVMFVEIKWMSCRTTSNISIQQLLKVVSLSVILLSADPLLHLSYFNRILSCFSFSRLACRALPVMFTSLPSYCLQKITIHWWTTLSICLSLLFLSHLAFVRYSKHLILVAQNILSLLENFAFFKNILTLRRTPFIWFNYLKINQNKSSVNKHCGERSILQNLERPAIKCLTAQENRYK